MELNKEFPNVYNNCSRYFCDLCFKFPKSQMNGKNSKNRLVFEISLLSYCRLSIWIQSEYPIFFLERLRLKCNCIHTYRFFALTTLQFKLHQKPIYFQCAKLPFGTEIDDSTLGLHFITFTFRLTISNSQREFMVILMNNHSFHFQWW